MLTVWRTHGHIPDTSLVHATYRDAWRRLPTLPLQRGRASGETKSLQRRLDRCLSRRDGDPLHEGGGRRFECVGELPRTTGDLQVRAGPNRGYGNCGLRLAITAEALRDGCSLRLSRSSWRPPFRK